MIRYFGMVCGIFGLDGFIKKRIDEKEEKPEIVVGNCKITRCRNKGAMYSVGEKYPDRVRMMSASMLAGIAIHWLHTIVGRKSSKVEKAGASLLLGGSISNVWDRFTRNYVVDYIHIDKKFLRKIIFNLSDVCIVIGGCITMLVSMLRFIKDE